MASEHHPRLAIVGGGPIGIEAALAAAERRWPFTLYEAAPAIAGHVRAWGHVRLFTPWELSVSDRLRRALGDAVPRGGEPPTGDELIERVIEPAAAALGDRVRLGTRVSAVAREGLLKHEEISSAERGRRPFRLLVTDPDGRERVERADVVLDCSGTYGTPNALGDGGIPAPGELALGNRIERRLPDLVHDAGAWAGRRILLTGSGHSAQTAARDLARLAAQAPGTEVVWAVRGEDRSFGAIPGDTLPARADLNREAARLAAGAGGIDAQFGTVTESVHDRAGRIAVSLRNGSVEEVEVDRVLALNGSVGDASLYRQLQVHECYATAAPMKLSAALLAQSGTATGDCLAVTAPGPEALLNPEPGFFILGAKSYGRNSQFLLRTGWQQVDDALGLIA